MDSCRIRNFGSSFIQNNDFESGIFWLEKAHTLDPKNDEIIYHYLMALIKTQSYSLVLSHLKKREDFKIIYMYFAALCYSALEQCGRALESLSHFSIKDEENFSITDFVTRIIQEAPFVNPLEILGDILFIKATLLEYSGHNESTKYYAFSLLCNPLKYSCARRLFEDGLILHEEGLALISKIRNFDLIFKFYDQHVIEMALELYENIHNSFSSIYNGELSKSIDIRRWKAQNLLNTYNFKEALNITTSIMFETENSDHLSCVTHSIALFQNLSDSLLQILSVEIPISYSENFSSRSISMFIGSLRKISEGKSTEALQVIKKTVALNWHGVIRLQPWCLSPSSLWMIQGLASWACGDNENALASFISAADSTPGLIWPWFSAGALHARHGQYNLALPYLTRSYKIAKKSYSLFSPIIANEIACSFYKKKMYNEAVLFLKKVLDSASTEKNEQISAFHSLPTYYLNIAHCYLKLNDLKLALDHASQGLSLNQTSSPLIRLVGYIHDLLGSHEQAQMMYHRSLLLSPQILDLIPRDSSKRTNFANLPPDANCRMYRQQDIFCSEMLKFSQIAEAKKFDKSKIQSAIKFSKLKI